MSYIDKLSTDEVVAPVLKLADFCKLYSTRLDQLGVKQTSRVHSTKLKNRILSQFPDMSDYREGRDVLLAFNKDIGLALKKAYEKDYDDKAVSLAKAAKIVRRDIF